MAKSVPASVSPTLLLASLPFIPAKAVSPAPPSVRISIATREVVPSDACTVRFSLFFCSARDPLTLKKSATPTAKVPDVSIRGPLKSRVADVPTPVATCRDVWL